MVYISSDINKYFKNIQVVNLPDLEINDKIGELFLRFFIDCGLGKFTTIEMCIKHINFFLTKNISHDEICNIILRYIKKIGICERNLYLNTIKLPEFRKIYKNSKLSHLLDKKE